MTDESQTTEVKETEESSEKQTNRVFTQSEVDIIAAKQVSKYKEQLSDYENLKAQNESLAKEKKEREMAEMSELEKLNTKLADIENEKARLAAENSAYKQNSRKLEILNTDKYADLPMKAKNAIKASDNDEEIIKEADEWLDVFKRTTGDIVDRSFGIKHKDTTDTIIAHNSDDVAKGLKARVQAKLEGFGAIPKI
jgi:hypothetical protein